MMHYGYGGMYGGMWWVHYGFQIVILVLFFLILRWVLAGSKKEEPLEILKRRFVKGEINEKEYKRLKKEFQ